MENQQNNKGVIALLIVIIVLLLTLCILFATGTITFKFNDVDNNETNSNVGNKVEDNSNNNIDVNSGDINSILEKLNGVWGHGHYVISVEKDNKQYIQGQYGTDGLLAGTISNIKEIGNNKYELEVFIEGCTGNDCIDEKEEETKIISIEIDTTRNIIVNNNNEYQFITKNHSDEDTISEFFSK